MKRSPLKRSPFRRKPKADPITPETTAALLKRSGGRCEFVSGNLRCDQPGDHRHHILRRSHGDHSLENLLHVCHWHHAWIHDNVAISYREGWLRRSGLPSLPPPTD